MHIRSGLAFRSPLHARALPNLQERAMKAMRSVGRFRGTLRTAYTWLIATCVLLHYLQNGSQQQRQAQLRMGR